MLSPSQDIGTFTLVWGLDTDQDLTTGRPTTVVSGFGHEMHIGEILVLYQPFVTGLGVAEVQDGVTLSPLGTAAVTVGTTSITIAVPYGPAFPLSNPDVLFSVASGTYGPLVGDLFVTDVAPSAGTLTATPIGPATAIPEPSTLGLFALLASGSVLRRGQRARTRP